MVRKSTGLASWLKWAGYVAVVVVNLVAVIAGFVFYGNNSYAALVVSLMVCTPPS